MTAPADSPLTENEMGTLVLDGGAWFWLMSLPKLDYNLGSVRQREQDVIVTARPGGLTHISYMVPSTRRRIRSAGSSLADAANHLAAELARRKLPVPPVEFFVVRQEAWTMFDSWRAAS